jgi:hypothetical protein
MSKKNHNLKVGDSVIVNPGTKDPDLGGDISGWQGCITELSEPEGDSTIMIAWTHHADGGGAASYLWVGFR